METLILGWYVLVETESVLWLTLLFSGLSSACLAETEALLTTLPLVALSLLSCKVTVVWLPLASVPSSQVTILPAVLQGALAER